MSNPNPKVKQQDDAEIKAFGDCGERMLTIRLKENFRNRLNKIAIRRGISLNQMVRRVLFDFAIQQEPTDAE